MDKKNYIWYVCYGSNLCFERFMCYLTGEGNEKYNIDPEPKRRCLNPNPPIQSKVISIPFKLYFAKESSRWDQKGVCFLDEKEGSNTVGRAYLITEEQYEHVWLFEGKRDWYPKQLELGSIDGIRAVTFTAANKIFPERFPCDRYYQVVFDGLLECGLSNDEAKVYLSARLPKEQ